MNFISIWYFPYKGLNCFKIEMSVTLTQFSQLHMYISIICVLKDFSIIVYHWVKDDNVLFGPSGTFHTNWCI